MCLFNRCGVTLHTLRLHDTGILSFLLSSLKIRNSSTRRGEKESEEGKQKRKRGGRMMQQSCIFLAASSGFPK